MSNKHRSKAPKVVNSSNEKVVTKTVDTVTTTSNSMQAKVEPQATTTTTTSTTTKTEDSTARMVAIVLAIFGILVIITMVILIVANRANPGIDSTIAKPTFDSVPANTKDDKIVLTGQAVNVSKVMIFVDGRAETGLVDVDKDGNFSYEYKFSDERTYKFESAAIRGAILLSRSEFSDAVEVTFDKTAPSKNVEFVKLPAEVNTNDLTVTGKADPNSQVTLIIGTKKYSGEVDKDGNFEIKNVPLEKGENKFFVEISDKAGNVTKVGDPITVVYSGSASVNGNGAKTNIPQADGELEDAMAFLFENKVMFGVGLIALVLFLVNGAVVMAKLRRE